MLKNLSNIVVVFDLDDTLYYELDYQQSGYSAVIDLVSEVYECDKERLQDLTEGGGDVLQRICDFIGVPSVKESLLWAYRLHKPDIRLHPEAAELLEFLQDNGATTLILTDGRSISQRLKLAALGLSSVEVYISDEYSSEKPDLLRFETICKKHVADQYVYIGDNTDKDFVAPNKLGWLTVGLEPSEKSFYKADAKIITEDCCPKYWVKSLKSVGEILC